MIRLIPFLLLFIVVSCGNPKMSLGNEIVSKIETYKVKNGKLPASLSEIGI